MSADIVARLRVLNHHAKKLAENESLHDLYRDAFTRCENLTWEAADEIERLRHELDGAQLAYRGASYDRDRMRSERDEARREVCGFAASDIDRANRIEVKGLVSGLLAVSRKPIRPVDVARSRGWDCFKGASNDR